MHKAIRIGVESQSFTELDRLRQSAAPQTGINRCGIVRNEPQRDLGAIAEQRVPQDPATVAENAYDIAAVRINFCDIGFVDPGMAGTHAFLAAVFYRDR